jgi:two-component system, NarL family, invasion response regulator UvrY
MNGDAQAAESVAAAASKRADGRVGVLVVDDQRIFRRAAASLIRSIDQLDLVAEARTGEEAVELARNVRPGFVLMDVRLPRMSGIDAARAILRDDPSTRILLMSTHERGDLPPDLDACGATGFERKQDLTAALLLERARRDPA